MRKISKAKRRHLLEVASANERQQGQRRLDRDHPVIKIWWLDTLTPAAERAAQALNRLVTAIENMGPIALPRARWWTRNEALEAHPIRADGEGLEAFKARTAES